MIRAIKRLSALFFHSFKPGRLPFSREADACANRAQAAQ
jgi:hypothetical protein